VISAATFEFGPMLVGKSREGYNEGKCNDSAGRVRITNNGLFALHVDFTFKKDFENACFIVEPPSMDLEVDETRDLTIWAFPPSEGLFEDELVCCILENPHCPTFKISVHGSKPVVKLESTELKFERQLPGRSERKQLTLSNTSMLPAKWELKNVDALEEELKIFPASGTLPPAQSCTLSVSFQTIADKPPLVIARQLNLEVSDANDLLGVSQTTVLAISAESYNINTSIMLGAPDPKAAPDIEGAKHLDFGMLRVHATAKKTLTLINNGKYNVNFKWVLKGKRCQPFRVEPKEGVLEPMPSDPKATSKPVTVELHFAPTAELAYSQFDEIRCQFYETATGEHTHTVVPTITARATFSKYRITPASGLHFGALVYNTKKSRTLTIANTGEFEFTYTVADWADVVSRPTTAVEAAEAPKGGKPAPAPAKGAAKGAVDALVRGPFKVLRPTDTVPVGGERVIEIEFDAQGSNEYAENLAIQISDRDLSAEKHGVKYSLAGDSCIPSINCSDMVSVFEEHTVVKRLEAQSAEANNVFASEQRTFHFGAVFVGKQVEARIRLTNASKIPCNVDLVCK